jgi:glycosyltransferase involved in cell wall biosynthesis
MTMQSGPAKILLVPSSSVPSGVTSYVAEMCEALDPGGCACLVSPGSHLEAKLPANCGRLPSGPGRAAMTLALSNHGRAFAFVQTHGARALLAARMARLPTDRLGHVFHEVAENQGVRGALELRLARGLRVAANAPATAASFERRLRVPVEVIPPVVRAPDLLPRREAERLLGLPGSELTIGVVGRLAPVKSPALVLEAVARLDRRPLRVVYIGDGPERGRLLSRARALGVAVSFVGSRPTAESLLGSFDVVACPSRAESFGLVMAQAAAADIPIAVVDSPGARYVSDEGRLIDLCPATPGGLATALVAALEAPVESRERLRACVLARFGPEPAHERIGAFYAREVGTTNWSATRMIS